MAKNLLIVESPAKAKTINNYLGKDFIVKSSFGHIRDLSKKNLGVDVENGFQPQYEVDSDKKKVVAELKKLAKEAEVVWLASDEDREGEAIAWHLSETLGLSREKSKRIVFHEITKPAILHAIDNPRDIDYNLVNAQQARRVLDRLVGFELSPLLWKKVKPSLSAGRVQSVAVRLIVDREQEINQFNTETYYKVNAEFQNTDNQTIHAELNHRFKDKKSANEFLESCIGLGFTVNNVEKKPAKKSPAPPFTTSSLQQEANRKLNYSVSKTMMLAQQLYEAGHITYMRTDSTNLSGLALKMAKDEIVAQYGETYSNTRNYTTKTKGAQEAHEAIRPTNFANREAGDDNQQKRLYDLILKRALASQMSDAQIEKTIVTISSPSPKYQFVAEGEVILFDGFLKVYNTAVDEDSELNDQWTLPAIKATEKLEYSKITATQKFTKQPARYSEAALVKKMEELGIGRPSTYAPTITTIVNRGYVAKDEVAATKRDFDELTLIKNKIAEKLKSEQVGGSKGRLSPTDIGTLVNDFLSKYFENIIDYNFTADVEKEFDLIADGKAEWNKTIKDFYGDFHQKVSTTATEAERFSGERLLGIDPESGKNVYARIGKFGPIIQIGEATDEEKPRFAGLQTGQTISNITFDDAMALFKFPRSLGQFEGKELKVSVGRFGPYIQHNSLFYSLPKEDQPSSITLERSIEVIHAKRDKDVSNTLKTFEHDAPIVIMNGRFGPYISYKKKNYKIAKGTDLQELTLEKCLEIIEKLEKNPSKGKAFKGKAKK
jgi:DNA topoisomerase-1